jgi:hypothetical protein
MTLFKYSKKESDDRHAYYAFFPAEKCYYCGEKICMGDDYIMWIGEPVIFFHVLCGEEFVLRLGKDVLNGKNPNKEG